MTQDEIIEMARQIATQASKVGPYRTWTYEHAMSLIMQLVDVSAAKEREACAKLVESFQRDHIYTADLAGAIGAIKHKLADAIRARSNSRGEA